MLPQPRIATLLLSGAVLAACAAEPTAVPLRVLVKLVHSSSDPAAIAGMVSRAAGVPARYVAASSPQWHALTLACDGPRECETALGRLRAERAAFEAVERDERKRIVTP
jgi:hypothetical protein